ncbi:MAG TPA: ABC transporter permease [Streptosporangiaceae bacterium]|nr:ABC transporter permease [Streptosporangiaceae bacterium]
MSTAVRDRPATDGITDGGIPARQAVIRWALRLFRREWRQQILVLAMLTVAVATMILGAAVATNTPPASPNAAIFGTAKALISVPGTDPHLAADIAAIRARYGTVDVIENQSLATGLAAGVELRAQDPSGPYGGPLLSLVSGHYPSGPGQVAMTSQVASIYNVHTGGVWHEGGKTWRVTGIVQNPANLLDQFALVAPGQVSAPSQATILLGTRPASSSGLPPGAVVSDAPATFKGLSPAVIVLVVAVLGMVFIGLVAAAGFAVMAQRRLRALGMLSALGATERNVQLVMVAGGAIVGVVATIAGAVIGFGAWMLYYPHLATVTAHTVDPANLPWLAIIIGMALAVLTAILAARRPAAVVARVPVVAALSGRPPSPKGAHRAARPGLITMAAGLVLLAFSGGWAGNGGKDSLFLLGGLVAVVVGSFLVAPLCVALLAAAAGPRAPVAARIALRDLVRYRARSGAALAATSFAVFLAVLITIIASVRFSNVLDYTGANLTPSQLMVYTPTSGGGPGLTLGQSLTPAQTSSLHAKVDSLAHSLHAQYVLALYGSSVGLTQEGTGNNNFSGTIYVATPALLRTYGIKPSQIEPGADFLTSRPGLAGLPRMLMLYGNFFGGKGGPPPSAPCPAGQCLAHPRIQEMPSLPTGVHAPNTVVTMAALQRLHQPVTLAGWMIQTPRPLTQAQISAARQMALTSGATIETKSAQLGLSQISNGATAIGILIALGVLAMTVGLIRSETAGELRTLTATGAGGRTRRMITAATAGALALLGALLGTVTAVAAALAWARSSLSTTFGNVPGLDMVIILAGLPLIAAVGGWLLAGRQPPAIARQPLE